jgi:hypothetical protein
LNTNENAADERLEEFSDRRLVNQEQDSGVSNQLVLGVVFVWAWYFFTTGPNLH